jgi:type II secretory pathway component PulF
MIYYLRSLLTGLAYLLGYGWFFPSGKYTREQTLLNLLQVSLHDTQNGIAILHHYAQRFHRTRRHAIEEIALLKANGVQWDDLMFSPAASKLFSQDTRRIIIIAAQNNTLDSALIWRADQLKKQAENPLMQAWEMFKLYYIGFICIATGLFIFIMPKNKEVFEYFDLTPKMRCFEIYQTWGSFVFEYFWWLLFLPLLLLIWTQLQRFVLWLLSFFQRKSKFPQWSWKIFNTTQRVLLLKLIADAIENHRVLPPLVAQWADSEPIRKTHKQLIRICEEIASGKPLSHVLDHEHVISHQEAILVDSALKIENAPWALRYIADQYVLRDEFRKQRRIQFASLCMYLVMIIIAGLTAAAYLPSIFNMISDLSLPKMNHVQ